MQFKKVIKELVFFILEGLAPFFDQNRPIEKAAIKKILVAERGGIGDLMQVLPAMETLHVNFPAASISLLASPSAKGVLSLCPERDIISEVIDYDLRRRHKSFLKKLSLILSLKKKGYNLVYSPDRGDGMREEVLMNLLIGAPHRLGFKKGKVGLFNTVKIEFREDIPILKQNLAILEAANLDIYSENIKLDVPKKDINAAKELLSEYNFNNSFPLISIHPGASWYTKYKCWPIEKCILLIRYLLKEFRAKVIIIGSKSEIEMGERILGKIQNPAVVSIIGRTTIAQMAAVIKLSHLFIGNDSGPLHIALAAGVPSVGIFGPTSPAQVISHPEHCLVVRRELPCSPCYTHQHRFEPPCGLRECPECLENISVLEVENAVKRLLAGEKLNANRN